MQFPSDNIAVMVSFSTVKIPINKMVNIIENATINAQYPQEEESIRTILYECLNEYLQYSLPKIPTGANICFEHYLNDRFRCVADVLNPPVLDGCPPPDKRLMMFLNSQWAIAVSELGRQLIPGVRDLNNHQQEVGEIYMYPMQNDNAGLYVLSGTHYDQIDMDEGGL